jgi:hypothetical protein
MLQRCVDWVSALQAQMRRGKDKSLVFRSRHDRRGDLLEARHIRRMRRYLALRVLRSNSDETRLCWRTLRVL